MKTKRQRIVKWWNRDTLSLIEGDLTRKMSDPKLKCYQRVHVLNLLKDVKDQVKSKKKERY